MNTTILASEKTLRDEFAGQALAGLISKLPVIDQTEQFGIKVDDKLAYNREVAGSCYELAEAMLAEKAWREAVVQQSSTTQDAGKAAEPATCLQIVAHERARALDRVAELEAANRELVEALELFVDNVAVFVGNSHPEVNSARAILSKHKGAK